MIINTKLVTILVGPPCVGKTSYLKNIDYNFVISSDDIVEILCQRKGIEYPEFFKNSPSSEIRTQHNDIFKQLVIESKNFAHVVWDLTNLTKKARRRIINHYPSALFNAITFYFHGQEDLLLERNRKRFKQDGKYIDEAVMQSMFLSYQCIQQDEGFNDVKVIHVSSQAVKTM